mgnify:CR=1 FL=1
MGGGSTGARLILELLLSAGAGVLIGLVYFGGLWWTARRVSKTKAPGALLAGSFVLRMIFLLAALLVVTRGEPLSIAAALVGVWLSRRAAVAYFGRERPSSRRGSEDFAREGSPGGNDRGG